MKRLLSLISLLATLAVALGLAACGGGGSSSSSTSTSSPSSPQVLKTITAPSGQRSYKVKLPDGKVVIQAHDPRLAEPPKGLLKLTPPASLSSTVEQYDSVDIGQIPRSAHYAAGYVDGLYRTYRLLLGHFPVVVGISVSTRDGADCFDMEPGNPGPTSAGPWARFEFASGHDRPCEYSMLAWMPAIKANLSAYGIPTCVAATQTHCVRLWDANWTFVRHLDSGYACTQWTDHAGGLNLDESTCASWFYKTTPIVPAGPTVPGYLPKTVFAFDHGRDHASEYNTVRTWLVAKCRNPVQRQVCKSTYFHLQVLAGRDYFVAYHTRDLKRAVKHPRWSDYPGVPLGSRFALMEHLITFQVRRHP